VKNLVRKAVDRVHDEFHQTRGCTLVKKAQHLTGKVDWEHTLDGLALLASEDQAVTLNLPFHVKARAMVDETIATRDLLYAFNQATP
jgi:hypothetical protein